MKKLVFFFRSASAGGICLMLASIVGIIFANSPWADAYFSLLDFQVGPLSVLLWINDALMAIFFLLVGLEIKREMVSGQLNTNAKRFLPGIAAFFGLSVPAIIYIYIAGGTPEYVRGWAIPTATDIAFALGVLALLGSRVPVAMKVFLTALAIMDDLMAIIIIALFYSDSLQLFYLASAAAIIGGLILMNRSGYIRPLSYIFMGIALWICLLKSGLHATLAGVILAMTIPYHGVRRFRHVSPLIEWEHALHNWVTFLIIPVFGFANAGVSFAGFEQELLLDPVVVGITAGLFLGKQIGVFGTVFLLVKTKLVPMPERTTWIQVYGISLLCGIGFTMSLFVAALAFPGSAIQEHAKIGIFAGSIISGIAGYIVLRLTSEPLAEE